MRPDQQAIVQWVPKGARVLDLGCGTGEHALMAAGLGLDATGLDHLLCFSDRLPGGLGPRRVSQKEIRTSFRDGWEIESIEAATIETTRGPLGVPAWHATITRTAGETRRT